LIFLEIFLYVEIFLNGPLQTSYLFNNKPVFHFNRIVMYRSIFFCISIIVPL
jgi:hypothetical protein